MTNAAQPSIARTDRLDALAQPSSMVWLLTTGECIAAILAVTPGYTGNRWVYFGLASLGIQWVLLLTLASLLVLRRLLASRSALTVACTALALMQLVTAVISTVMFGLFGEYWHLGQGDWKEFSVQLSVISFLIAVLGMGALHNHLRLQQMAIRAKQAELDALTARVQPHFLFNTLNMAIALLHARPQQAEKLLLDLSELFRAALTTQDKVPLADEIELTKRYLEIEALRFGERLSVRWDLPTRLPEISVPNLTLQPLVENAVHHGIEGAREGERSPLRSLTPMAWLKSTYTTASRQVRARIAALAMALASRHCVAALKSATQFYRQSNLIPPSERRLHCGLRSPPDNKDGNPPRSSSAAARQTRAAARPGPA